ncbi:MAG: GNAT family N-acetyltransferase [Chitinophagaceae bacterium]|nr:GNAT family N-acetyltransferase [Anaerolineae bacterium]
MMTRNVRESDYHSVIAVVDSWWGGRQMSDMLPRLFFTHFQETSFIVEENDQLVAFLIGFFSQTHSNEAYIHFVGVHPEYRTFGIGAQLYGLFFETVRAHGCDIVRCVTSPMNKGSIAFHTRMGFEMQPGDDMVDGIPVKTNYDGAGQSRVLFVKAI